MNRQRSSSTRLVHARAGLRRCLLVLLALLAVVVPSTAVGTANATEGPWFPEAEDAASTDTPAAAISTGSGGEFTTVRRSDGQIFWRRNSNAWAPIPGGWRTPNAPAIVIANGQPWVFIHGQSDNRIYYNRLVDPNNNQWSGWSGVVGANSASGTPSVTFAYRQVYVFYNSGGAIRYAAYSFEPAGWAIVNRVVPANGYTTSSPAATVYSVNRDRIAVFHRGVDNHVYRQDHNPTTGAWDNRWRDLGGNVNSRPVASATGNLLDQVTVAVRGQDNLPWFMTFDLTVQTSGWRSITAFEGSTVYAPSLVSNIAAAITYVLITHRYWTGQLWEKRIV